jgi:hypothetical protein
MCSITLNRVYQIGDQIVSLSQLRVDVGPALPAILPQADEPVVNEHQDQADYADQYQDYQHHGFTLSPSREYLFTSSISGEDDQP